MRFPGNREACAGQYYSRPTDRTLGRTTLGTLLIPLRARVLTLTLALFFVGCSVLSPKQDRTRFIMLAPVTYAASNGVPSTAGLKLSALAIGLGPVQLPEYLDRPELVIRTSPNGFELSETDRWAEPLTDNFRHVLANDLTNLLGTTNIIQYPWYPGTRLDYIVRVQVQRFEADASQTAELIARWDLRTAQNDQVLASRQAELSHPMTILTGDAAAAALSVDLAQLARQIASAIIQVEQQRLARDPR
jgi:uncharacterized protein